MQKPVPACREPARSPQLQLNLIGRFRQSGLVQVHLALSDHPIPDSSFIGRIRGHGSFLGRFALGLPDFEPAQESKRTRRSLIHTEPSKMLPAEPPTKEVKLVGLVLSADEPGLEDPAEANDL